MSYWKIKADPTYKNLVKEFTDYRWVIMLQCADRCEEIGGSNKDGKRMALIWRWLAKWKRWPAARVGEKFGWTYRDDMVAKYPHGLPEFFPGLSSQLKQNIKYSTEQEALEALVRVLMYSVDYYKVFTDDEYMKETYRIK